MNPKYIMPIKVLGGASVVIIPLVAAAWLIPPDFPLLLRQCLLAGWGVGAMAVVERLLFGSSARQVGRALGLVPARRGAVVVALLVSIPMWLFLPLYAGFNGQPIRFQPDWAALLLGVVLVNGVAEEVIHRAFVFGHLRREQSFAAAATTSAALFAVQHLYLILSIGWTAGVASVVLAALLAYPLAYLFEQGGYSIAGPAILHTSSNAPVMVLALPASFVTSALVSHMAVVLISIYLVFAFPREGWRGKNAALSN
jgi:membrane protease YdiL (CAAX protease family)